MATATGLTGSTTDTTANALAVLFGSCSKMKIIQSHYASSTETM
jgi:hypothetical protein